MCRLRTPVGCDRIKSSGVLRCRCPEVKHPVATSGHKRLSNPNRRQRVDSACMSFDCGSAGRRSLTGETQVPNGRALTPVTGIPGLQSRVVMPFEPIQSSRQPDVWPSGACRLGIDQHVGRTAAKWLWLLRLFQMPRSSFGCPNHAVDLIASDALKLCLVCLPDVTTTTVVAGTSRTASLDTIRPAQLLQSELASAADGRSRDGPKQAAPAPGL